MISASKQARQARPRGGGRLIERGEELEQLRAATADARAGSGSSLLILGPAGIGKTALSRAVAEQQAAGEFHLLAARGGDLERELPWSVTRELFAGELSAQADSLDEVLSGAAGIARSIIEGSLEQRDPAVPGTDLLSAALHGLYWLTSNLAERDPLLVVVDDAHLADPTSLHFLDYLAQRLADLRVLLLLTARPPEPGGAGLPAGLADPDHLLRPQPLSETGVAQLLHQLRGTEPDRRFASSCHQLTAGNPHLLGELAHELAREGVEPTDEHVPMLRGLTPEGIGRAVLLRIARFPAEVKDLAEAIAVLGVEVPIGVAAELAKIDPDRTGSYAAELAVADILADGVPLAYAHPIIRSAIYEEIPAARRSRLHARAAEILARGGAEASEVAIQLLRAEPTGEQSAVDVLRRAAREAFARGAPESSSEFLKRALAEPPSRELLPGLLLELAESEAATGSARALDRLEDALDHTDSPKERGEILFRLGWLLFNAGRPGEASRAFTRGGEALGDSDDELAAMLQTASMGTGAVVGEVQLSDLTRALDEMPPTARTRTTEREVLTQLSLARVLAAVDCAEARSLAERALGRGAMLRESGLSLTFGIAASCLVWCDALDEVEREIDLALELLRERGDALGAAYVRFGRSWACYWRGRVGESAADAGTAARAWSGGGQLSGQLPLARYWEAISLVELDQLDEAIRVFGEDDGSWDEPYRLSWRIGSAKLALAAGNPGRAWSSLEGVEQEAESVPFFHSPGAYDWRSDAAIAALRLGEAEEARRLAESEFELASRFGSPRAIGIALRTCGLIEGGKRGIELLARSVAVLEPSPSRLELCRSLVDLGAAIRRDGGSKRAKEPLARALDIAHGVGAVALERRARDELTAAGARPRRAMVTGAGSLTPSERRVCDLAISGLRNREIAEQLFVSLRTVETHLTHAYQKLDIAARGELAAALADDDDPPPAAP